MDIFVTGPRDMIAMLACTTSSPPGNSEATMDVLMEVCIDNITLRRGFDSGKPDQEKEQCQ
jgi:hypothetical protein